MIINRPHFTLDDWLRDSLEILGRVSNTVTGACISGGTEEANAELRKLAPDVQALAKSFTDLVKPQTAKTDVKAELAKLRAALGVPKPSIERPGGIVTSALQSELADIAAQVNKSGKGGASCWRLSTRLQELAQRVRDGVYEDSDLPF